MEFQEFPKIARLSRDVIVTEKIDGTNAQVQIVAASELTNEMCVNQLWLAKQDDLFMLAGSRTRYITPEQDNHGFAKWVKDHAAELFTLGPGRHYGEWWGSGIQRGYGLENGQKRFSLFNVGRWHMAGATPFTTPSADPRQPARVSTEAPSCCHLVPVLYRGSFDEFMGHSEMVLDKLREGGSWAAPGFMKPEGIVVFHTASGFLFKKTLEKDEQPKSQVA